jgi:hypothetical protein
MMIVRADFNMNNILLFNCILYFEVSTTLIMRVCIFKQRRAIIHLIRQYTDVVLIIN